MCLKEFRAVQNTGSAKSLTSSGTKKRKAREHPATHSKNDLTNEISESIALPKKQVKRAFNGLTTREWTLLSRNVWSDLSSPRHKRHLAHGAVFPLKLAQRLIQLYSDVNDLVFDPFAGLGTTLIAASQLGRRSFGFELNPIFVEMAREWILEEQSNELDQEIPEQQLVLDDCRNVVKYLLPDSIQVTVTSPPYANFIQRSVADRKKTHKKSKFVLDNNSRVKQYSNNENDFGNLDYEDFLDQSGKLFVDLLHVTKPDGYAVWIVKDYRLPPYRPYVSMHSDLAQVAQKAGWLWHDLVIWDQNEQRSLVLLGYPTRFYTNQNCSFLVVLRKNAT